VPRSSVSLVLGLGSQLGSVYCTFRLSHLRTIDPSHYRTFWLSIHRRPSSRLATTDIRRKLGQGLSL